MAENYSIDALKSIIRSILLAIGGKCTLEMLVKEFRAIEFGENLHQIAKSHGRSIVEFLRCMPDVVTLRNINNDFIVERVSSGDRDMKFLESMTVSGQAKKKANQAINQTWQV